MTHTIPAAYLLVEVDRQHFGIMFAALRSWLGMGSPPNDDDHGTAPAPQAPVQPSAAGKRPAPAALASSATKKAKTQEAPVPAVNDDEDEGEEEEAPSEEESPSEEEMTEEEHLVYAKWSGYKDYLERIAKLQKLTERLHPGSKDQWRCCETTSGPMPEGETEYQRTFIYDDELKELPAENAQSFCRKKGIITP
jgi:hypothetical protein